MKTNVMRKVTHATPAAPSALGLVSGPELESLRVALARGLMPFDLEQKLAALDGHDVVENDLRHKSLLFLALLEAVRAGAFHEVTPAQQERILRVLAYLRKDDDAIPDTQENGYLDDLAEVRSAFHDLEILLQHFKHWRLKHQVPSLWMQAA